MFESRTLFWIGWFATVPFVHAQSVSELDYLSDVPVVLSVSRLSQPLHEAPGAVTILDQAFIRASGARNVADLLRLVPGFQSTTSYETDVSTAAYHGRVDDFSSRMQVLVNGRSVYFGNQDGTVGLGLQQLDVQDIERIEVLRGSNSASYGARAFLGVINIVSRSLRQGPSSRVSLQAGTNGVADSSARITWGETDAVYEVSFSSTQDDGLQGAFGKNQSRRVNMAALWDWQEAGELEWRLGGLQLRAGTGSTDATEYGNPARFRGYTTGYTQVRWQRSLDANHDIAVEASHSVYTLNDAYTYGDPSSIYYGWSVDSSSLEINDALSVQSTQRLGPTQRLVLGAELRQERDVSESLYSASGGQVLSHFERLYSNWEWHFQPDWTLNAGALAERSTLGGDSLSPRLMVNWQFMPAQTVRAGVSQAFRPPSAFEKFGVLRFWNPNHTSQTITFSQADGTLGSERLLVQELGYNLGRLGNGISADVRWFQEKITDGIRHNGQTPVIYLGLERYNIQGLEYQLEWRPTSATALFHGASWIDISQLQTNRSDKTYRTVYSAPKFSASLLAMHTLPSGMSVSMAYNVWQQMTLLSASDEQPYFSAERWDARIAKPFQWGRNKGSWHLTGQNIGPSYRDGDRKFYLLQQWLLGMTVEY
ncbi:TonB-dependent receptor [Curvibacter sp. CHRR-16]|uniref:TonB-dependent receptor plug domain-containing protein n=1 Tax=Curvibacter sp. CHRR-16 TaxID=2835872 RepID=UPI001BD97C45|nr:TonB-dependent receptor [Curvibacter sp. CHRR-16]MBT0568767.1 TonB-dependent receptor [Curvibacter sp. CHRR-16]